MKTGLTFGKALEAVEQGICIAREGWNGKGMFVFMRPSDQLPVDMIVNKVKSLPQSVKDYFDQDYEIDGISILQSDVKINFTSYLCMVNPNNIGENGWLSITNGWIPTTTDMLTKDWYTLD